MKNMICNVLGQFKGLRRNSSSSQRNLQKLYWTDSLFTEFDETVSCVHPPQLTHLLKLSPNGQERRKSLQIISWSDIAAKDSVPYIYMYIVLATPWMLTHLDLLQKSSKQGEVQAWPRPLLWLWTRTADRFSPKKMHKVFHLVKKGISDLSRYERASHI